MSVRRRGLPLLWQREARHLQDEQRAFLRKRLSVTVSPVFDAVHAHRPELVEADCRLVAFSILAVFSSPSSHRIVMSHRRMESLLRDIATRVALCPIGSEAAASSGPPVDAIAVPVSRREQLLTAAVRMFDDRGYRTVNNDDIGEACGTTGPNVYNHFDTKLDLLVTAITRGFDRRDLAVRRALSRVADPRDTLVELLRVHSAFALADGHLVGLMATELGELPDSVRKACLRAQRDYLSLWVRALLEIRPGLDTVEAQFTVSAALTLIGNAARISQLQRRTDLADRLADLCTALLTDEKNPPAHSRTECPAMFRVRIRPRHLRWPTPSAQVAG